MCFYVKFQKNRDGITGEKYVIETLDFDIPSKSGNGTYEKNTKLEKCPYCETKIDSDSDFCIYCGKPYYNNLEDVPKSYNLNRNKLPDSELNE